METWPAKFLLNSDWTDTPSVALIEHEPEVGLPIRRLRSANIKHTLSASFVLNFDEFNDEFLPFMHDISNGLDSFYFVSPVDGKNAKVTGLPLVVHTAKLKAEGGQFYTIKRQSNQLYIVSVTFEYVTAM